MTAQHTPGPWYFSRWDQLGDARFYIAQADGAPYTPDYSDVATLIAETVSLERVSIQEANARLIAAAPDLLAALVNLLNDTQHAEHPDCEDGPCPTREARAAIQKATGGTHKEGA